MLCSDQWYTHSCFHVLQDMIPTVGFNMRKVTKGGVVIKLWDLGGQVGGGKNAAGGG